MLHLRRAGTGLLGQLLVAPPQLVGAQSCFYRAPFSAKIHCLDVTHGRPDPARTSWEVSGPTKAPQGLTIGPD